MSGSIFSQLNKSPVWIRTRNVTTAALWFNRFPPTAHGFARLAILHPIRHGVIEDAGGRDHFICRGFQTASWCCCGGGGGLFVGFVLSAHGLMGFQYELQLFFLLVQFWDFLLQSGVLFLPIFGFLKSKLVKNTLKYAHKINVNPHLKMNLNALSSSLNSARLWSCLTQLMNLHTFLQRQPTVLAYTKEISIFIYIIF